MVLFSKQIYKDYGNRGDGKPQLAQGAMPRAELRRLIDQLLLGGK